MTTTTTYVLDLQYADDPRTAGTKAATLARLLREGFPVPDGVVLAPEAAEDGADVAAAVRRLGDVPLAVRSSGVDEDLPDASYAGLYTTVLNVTGDGLADAVRQCWASASGERVRSYRAGTDETPRIALLIQPMVPAEAAGVAFTADPVTGDRGVVVVEAVAGLGERLVSGEAAPDAWEVRDTAAIRRTTASEPVLDADQARAVAALARRVEQHEGRPQDIEWALWDGKLVLLQARPVTTLTIEPVPVPVDPPPGYWTREDSHAPVPWSRFTRAVLAARTPAVRRMCTDLGLLFDSVEFRDIGGWEYVRIVPLGGKDRPAPPARLVPLLFRLVPMLRRRIATSVKAARSDVVGHLVRRWYDEWQPQFAARVAELRDVPVTELTDQELGHHFVRTMSLIHEGVEIHMRLHGPIQITLAELVFTCRTCLAGTTRRPSNCLPACRTPPLSPPGPSHASRQSPEPGRGPPWRCCLTRTKLSRPHSLIFFVPTAAGLYGTSWPSRTSMNDPSLCSAWCPTRLRPASTPHALTRRWPLDANRLRLRRAVGSARLT
jgi:rifampicin phosphotransferase